MRKLTFIYSFLLVIALVFSGCDRCINNDGCADTFHFRVVSKDSHQDLVFGADSVFHKDSVALYPDQPYLSDHSVSFYDSVGFRCALAFPVDTFFLKLSSADTDTLVMHYHFVKSQCCTASSRGYGQITDIQYNGITAKKEGDVYLFEK